ncbi:MAG: hypothetical protein JST30_07410 [Armatimonadetes bacterium]|nr:hypothetical protein [Armatimonadota bacterium]
MTSLALALALLQDKLPATPVTADWPAMRLENLLKRIGDKTGTTLRATGTVRDLTVVVHLKKQPAADVLLKIAQATDAQWTRDRDGFTLARTAAQDQALVKLDRDRQTASLQEQLEAMRTKNGQDPWNLAKVDDLVKAVDKIRRPPEDGRGMSLDGPRLASPLKWLLKRLFANVDADRLTALAPRDSIEWTSAGPLGPGAFSESDRKAITDYLAKQEEFLGVVANRLKESDRKDPLFKDIFDLSDPARQPLEFKLSVRDWLTRVAPYLIVNDPQGRQVSWAFSDVGEWLSRYPHVGFTKRLTDQKPAVKLRPDSVRFVRYLPQMLGTSPQFVVPFFDKNGFLDEDRPLFADPSTHDPLSFHVTDALTGLADALDDEMVAVVPDEFFSSVQAATVDGKIPWGSLWKAMSVRSILTMEEKDGVLWVRPALPDLSRRIALDRAPLAQLMRVVEEKGFVPYTDWALYCAKTRGMDVNQTVRYALLSPYEALGASTPHGISMYEDSTAEMVGLLSPAELGRLARGETVTFSRITPRQIKLLKSVGNMFPDDKGGYPHDERPLPDVRQITVKARKTLMRTRTDKFQGSTHTMIDDAARPGNRTPMFDEKDASIGLRDGVAYTIQVTWADGATTGVTTYELGRFRPEKGEAAKKAIEEFRRANGS